MDWLSKYRVVNVCNEKLVCIPLGDETLTIQGNRNDSSSEPSDHQPPSIQNDLNQQRMNELQEMSIQDMEDLKQHYLDEMLSLSNDLGVKDYRNEKTDIRIRRECKDMIDELKGKFNGMSIEINKKKELQYLEQVANLSTYPSQRFRSICYDDDDDYDYEESTIPLNEIISQLPPSFDSLIIRNEDLNTVLEKESDKFIKSSVEDLVLIPSESEDTSGSDSDNDESLFDEDVPEENVKIYSNPLFEFDDEYISSDVNPLFDEVLEDIECKDSDDVELLLHHDPSTLKMSGSSSLEGFTDEPPLEENDDLFDLESKNNEWKKILYDAPIDDFMTEDKVFDPEIREKIFSPTYDCPDFEDSRAPGFVHRPLKLQSLACLYMRIRYPISY
nr:hypothetical protein [Tanacetum cinerariifolium]